MGYRLENKDIDILGSRVKKIASGKRGDVYKFRNEALKIYPENYAVDSVLDEETARYLSSISTDRILLPRKILYYNNRFSGFSLRLVNKKGAKGKIINGHSEDFIRNVKLLEGDVERLSKKGILLNGMTPSNVVYNGEIYITDPSRYAKLNSIDKDSLDNLNRYQLHLLLSELVLSDITKDNFTKDTVSQVKELLSLKDDLDKSSCFFREILEGSESIKQFVKKI